MHENQNLRSTYSSCLAEFQGITLLEASELFVAMLDGILHPVWGLPNAVFVRPLFEFKNYCFSAKLLHQISHGCISCCDIPAPTICTVATQRR